MKELELLKNLYSQDLETRKNWYSHIAEVYNKVAMSTCKLFFRGLANYGLN